MQKLLDSVRGASIKPETVHKPVDSYEYDEYDYEKKFNGARLTEKWESNSWPTTKTWQDMAKEWDTKIQNKKLNHLIKKHKGHNAV